MFLAQLARSTPKMSLYGRHLSLLELLLASVFVDSSPSVKIDLFCSKGF